MRPSQEDRVRACLAKHPDWKDERVGRATGARVAEIRAARGGKPPAQEAAHQKKLGMTRGDFMAQYDPTTRVRRQLKAAAKIIQRGTIYKDYELRREVGCSDARLWREIAKDPEEGLSELQFVISGEGVYWSDKATVADILRTVTKAKAVA